MRSVNRAAQQACWTVNWTETMNNEASLLITSDRPVVSAGLTHTPQPDKGEVSFSLNDMETFLPYTKALKDFLAKYDDEIQRDQMKFEDCGGRFHFIGSSFPVESSRVEQLLPNADGASTLQ